MGRRTNGVDTGGRACIPPSRAPGCSGCFCGCVSHIVAIGISIRATALCVLVNFDKGQSKNEDGHLECVVQPDPVADFMC